MNILDFTTELFCRIDDRMADVPKHSQSQLHPSEIVTLAQLYAIKGVGARAFYRWARNNLLSMFPKLPDRTRLFRLFKTHVEWVERFCAAPTILGVADTYGVELIHPIREGRSPQQIGKKGLSNKRWIVGGKLGFVLNEDGRICAWDCDTANTHDSAFRPLVQRFDGQMIVLTDNGFHGQTGDPPNLKICQPGTWNCRMIVETVLSMLTVVCHGKHMRHRVWSFFHAHVGWMMAAYNVLVDWYGIQRDQYGNRHLHIAEFSL